MSARDHNPAHDALLRDSDAGGFAAMAPQTRTHSQASQRAHYRTPAQTEFHRSDRGNVTLLFGGLTTAHERLFSALLESRGFRVRVISTPELEDYRLGRTFANNGFCNPLYFTAGSLLRTLREEERNGLSHEQVCASFVYVTSRSCGPCRLGFYEQEYRNVLRNAGYHGLRVLSFSDTVSLRSGSRSEGLPFDVHFYTGLFGALMLGDVLNDLANRIRPYEIVPGSTDAVWENCIAHACGKLRTRPRWNAWMERLLPVPCRAPLEIAGRVLTWIMDVRTLRILLHARAQFQALGVDCALSRPVVKIIGEFWAQTTIGDGNFRAHRFLESHGAEVVVEPVTTWVLYLLFEARQCTRFAMQRIRLAGPDNPRRCLRLTAKYLRLAALRVAEMALRAKYNVMRACFRSVPDRLPSIFTLANLAKEYYNPMLLGGESHMEVGKTLYYTQCKRAHMVLSLKPFGCLPSGMSDGVQPLVRARHPELLQLSVETSGEGCTNAQSRMLMVLDVARQRAEEEIRRAWEVLERLPRPLSALIRRRWTRQGTLCAAPLQRHAASQAAQRLWSAMSVVILLWRKRS